MNILKNKHFNDGIVVGLVVLGALIVAPYFGEMPIIGASLLLVPVLAGGIYVGWNVVMKN